MTFHFRIFLIIIFIDCLSGAYFGPDDFVSESNDSLGFNFASSITGNLTDYWSDTVEPLDLELQLSNALACETYGNESKFSEDGKRLKRNYDDFLNSEDLLKETETNATEFSFETLPLNVDQQLVTEKSIEIINTRLPHSDSHSMIGSCDIDKRGNAKIQELSRHQQSIIIQEGCVGVVRRKKVFAKLLKRFKEETQLRKSKKINWSLVDTSLIPPEYNIITLRSKTISLAKVFKNPDIVNNIHFVMPEIEASCLKNE